MLVDALAQSGTFFDEFKQFKLIHLFPLFVWLYSYWYEPTAFSFLVLLSVVIFTGFYLSYIRSLKNIAVKNNADLLIASSNIGRSRAVWVFSSIHFILYCISIWRIYHFFQSSIGYVLFWLGLLVFVMHFSYVFWHPNGMEVVDRIWKSRPK